MRAVYWLAKEDIATVKYDSLLNFLDEVGLESVKNLRVGGNATYRSHQSAEGMQDAIATVLRVSQGESLFPCSLPILPYVPMFPCSLFIISEFFRTVMFRILFPCSQKLADVPLFPSIFCQCSLVPQNPWETLCSEV